MATGSDVYDQAQANRSARANASGPVATVAEFEGNPEYYELRPSGFSIRDLAANVSSGLQAITGGVSKLNSIRLTGFGRQTLTLGAYAVLSYKLELSKIVTPYDITVVDDWSDIEDLRPVQIAQLSQIGVTAVETTSDAYLSVALTKAFERKDLPLSALAGNVIETYDSATNLESLTAAQIRDLPAIGINKIGSSQSLTFGPAQAAAIVSAKVATPMSGSATVTLNFYGGIYKVEHFNVSGAAYDSFAAYYNSTDTLVAKSYNNTNGTGQLDLFASGLTFSAGQKDDVLRIGSDLVPVGPHSVQNISTYGRGDDTFLYSTSGFGHQTISDFTTSGLRHDVLGFERSMFNYLTAGMSISQELAEVLAHATQRGGSTSLRDSHGDTVTIEGLTKSQLAADAGSFRFT